MKLKTSLLLLLCLFFGIVSIAKNIAPAGLKVGDKVPQLLIKNIIGMSASVNKDTSLKLSSLSDKLLILDFWATYCTPCLRLLPKYDSLQTAFGDQVQFLLVTRESAQKASVFFKRFPYHLPSVTSDTLLASLFPHTSIPHEVWIKDGKVAAVTFGEDVNKASLIAMLGNKEIALEQKHDNLVFDEFEPLLINGNGGNSTIAYQSLITPYIPGLRTLTGFQRTPDKLISIALNTSVLALYKQACSHADPLMELDNRFIIDLPDSLKEKIDRVSHSSLHDWLKKYGFCYNLILPPNFKGDVSTMMLDDLNRFFSTYYQITAGIEKRKIDCLVLSRIKGTKPLDSKGGDPSTSIDDHAIRLTNAMIKGLDMELAQRYRRLPQPYLNDTGYNGPIDLSIVGDLSKLEELNKALLPSGLELKFKKKKIDMVVIRQTGLTLTH